MPLPSPLPIGFSASAILQTLARVESASQYALPFVGQGLAEAAARDWRQLIRKEDTARLAETITEKGITPYLFLDTEDRASLRLLAIKSPSLRAGLQEGAALIERSIGVTLPFRARIYAAGETVDTPLRGLSLFLNEREAVETDATEGVRQVFQIAQGDGPKRGGGVVEALRSPAHSYRLSGHIAEREIKRIAPLTLTGTRIVPLSSPANVSLHDREPTRIGRFSLLGLHLGFFNSTQKGALEGLSRHEDRIDVLCLGGAAKVRPELASEIIALIRPRLTLAAAAQSRLIRTSNHGILGFLAPESEAWLDLNPQRDTVAVHADDDSEWIASNSSSRTRDILEGARARVMRTIFGDIPTNRRDRHRSQSILDAVILQALCYLDFLQTSPVQASSLAAREDLLIRIIGEMIEPLSAPGADVDHIEAFKELLLRCGLLESQTGSPVAPP